MIRKIYLLITCLLLVSCAKSSDKLLVKVPIPTNSPQFNLDYVSSQEIKENHENIHSYDSRQYDMNFYIKNNPCIFSDYIEIKLGEINETHIIIEIGSHCNSEDSLDGVVFIDKEDLQFYPDSPIHQTCKAKLYYEFPDGIIPVNYLDYVDYATGIELF